MLVPWRTGLEQYCVNLYNSVSSFIGTVHCSVACLQLRYYAKTTPLPVSLCPLSFTTWRRGAASSVISTSEGRSTAIPYQSVYSVPSCIGTVQCSVACLQLKCHAKTTPPPVCSSPLSFTTWRRGAASSVLVLWRVCAQQYSINLYEII